MWLGLQPYFHLWMIKGTILTCAGAESLVFLSCIQHMFWAGSGSFQGNGKHFLMYQREPLQSQCGYLDLCYLNWWHRLEQPRTTSSCVRMVLLTQVSDPGLASHYPPSHPKSLPPCVLPLALNTFLPPPLCPSHTAQILALAKLWLTFRKHNHLSSR